MSISNDQFRAALGKFASGVTVVTTTDAKRRLHGITVSAFCSVSLEPSLVLVCIEKTTFSHYAFLESGVFVVNILENDQRRISEQFASPLPDKFAGVAFTANADGVPVLDDALVNLECTLKNTFDGGDHSIFVGEVMSARISGGDPLIYYSGGYRELEKKQD